MTEAEAITRIYQCAEDFVKTYDEFWPECPEAVGGSLDFLIEAVDALAKTDEVTQQPQPTLPDYIA